MEESNILDGLRKNSSSRETATAVLGHRESSNAVVLNGDVIQQPQHHNDGAGVQPLSISLQAYQNNLNHQISHLQCQLFQLQARSMFQSHVMQSMQTSSSSGISGGPVSHMLGLPVMNRTRSNEYSMDISQRSEINPPPSATVQNDEKKKNGDGASDTSHHQRSIFQGKLI